jgi:uncharacterized membrane protein YfcA
MTLKMLFLCVAGFVAAFVDSIAGGGGLISLPAFLLAGVSPQLSLGTNKLAASMASCTSSIKYARSGKVNYKLIKYTAPFTLVGAVLGVNAAVRINEDFLYTMVLILVLVVGVYTLFSKTVGLEDNFKGLNKRNVTIGIALAFGLGFYDGFFGPGTGSFLIFGLISIFGFDFIMAGGNARVLNFVSNITSLITFAIFGKIDYLIGLPVGAFMILGAYMGTKLAINKGSKLIKPIFVTMSLAVAVKMLYQLLVK